MLNRIYQIIEQSEDGAMANCTYGFILMANETTSGEVRSSNRIL
jgi:hypothetical protein